MKRRYVYLVERVNGANYIPIVATVSKSKAMAHARGLEVHQAHIIVTRFIDGGCTYQHGQSTVLYDSEALELQPLGD